MDMILVYTKQGQQEQNHVNVVRQFQALKKLAFCHTGISLYSRYFTLGWQMQPWRGAED